ncbi:hypothetical protein GOV10_04980 [Candidatus Woesearchaeota archaeon]|nr:hypothetical protein [Candidatus Woesearchaeota archaeon]
MKSELSAVDVHFLVRELQKLVGARVQRAYGLSQEEVYFQFHKEGKQLLRVKLPGMAYLAEHRPDFPKNPSGFIMFLRKRLNNARVKAIRQIGMDRIIIFELEGKFQEKIMNYELIIELVAPGNVLLIGQKPVKGGTWSDSVILHLLTPQSYKDRTLRGGIAYEAPPAPTNIKTDDENKLTDFVMNSGMDMLVKALAVGLSLGGEYAELVCKRAGLDKTKAKLEKADIKKAIAEAKKLLDDTAKPLTNEKEAILFPEKTTEGTHHETMSEALEEKFGDLKDESTPSEKKAKKGKKGTILEQQKQQQTGLETSAKENHRRGELIYENYQETQEIINQIKAGEEPSSKLYKKFDKKTGTITLEFKE